MVLNDHHHGVDACLMTSFNYGGKKARDVGLPWSNIMSDSIFYDSMGWGMTQLPLNFLFVCLFVFLGVVIAVFLSIEEMDSVLSL